MHPTDPVGTPGRSRERMRNPPATIGATGERGDELFHLSRLIPFSHGKSGISQAVNVTMLMSITSLILDRPDGCLTTLELDGASVFFTDDSASKLTGAEALGMRTHLYTDVPTLRTELRASGIDVVCRNEL